MIMRTPAAAEIEKWELFW